MNKQTAFACSRPTVSTCPQPTMKEVVRRSSACTTTTRHSAAHAFWIRLSREQSYDDVHTASARPICDDDGTIAQVNTDAYADHYAHRFNSHALVGDTKRLLGINTHTIAQ